MTPEEAISQIEAAVISGSIDDVQCGALKMAINALKNQPNWISVKDRMPECEKPVLVAVKNYRGNIFITKGMHEDGKMIPANSIWSWDEWDEFCVYDEEIDEYYIPEGWFECNEFIEQCGVIDQKVTHWMPLPEPPKEEDNG